MIFLLLSFGKVVHFDPKNIVNVVVIITLLFYLFFVWQQIYLWLDDGIISLIKQRFMES